MHKEVALTAEGQARLEQELIHLETVRRQEIGERIKEAKEFGDISENSEYDDAKNEQAFVEGRIMELEDILSKAQIIADHVPTDEVRIGAKVTIRIDGGATETYQIVGSAEADPKAGRISNQSPIGRALLGKKIGDEISVTAPDGVEEVAVVDRFGEEVICPRFDTLDAVLHLPKSGHDHHRN